MGDLLKRKADALKVKFREITKNLIKAKKDLGYKYSQALITLAKANYATGEVGRMVDENVKGKADVKLSVRAKALAGVTIPQFTIRNVDDEKYDNQMLGITGGGQTLAIARKQFFDLMIKIVEIAELQTAYLAVEECLKITNRRVNALEFIVVPRIEHIVQYIFIELEERAKEDKFKIKKILQVKKDNLEKLELELAMLENNVTEKDLVAQFEENDDSDDDIAEDERLFVG